MISDHSVIIILSIILFLLLSAVSLLAIFVFYRLKASIVGAPFAPSSLKKIDDMLILARINRGQTIVDLGSGDGRILIKAAERFKNIKCIGFEIDPFLYLLSLIKIRCLGLQNNIRIYRKNYWQINLNFADVIFIFLIPYQMNRMQEKFKKELKPQARIISNGFSFKAWQPSAQINDVFLYER